MIYIMSFKGASANRVYNREALATQLDAKIYIGENPCMSFVSTPDSAKIKSKV